MQQVYSAVGLAVVFGGDHVFLQFFDIAHGKGTGRAQIAVKADDVCSIGGKAAGVSVSVRLQLHNYAGQTGHVAVVAAGIVRGYEGQRAAGVIYFQPGGLIFSKIAGDRGVGDQRVAASGKGYSRLQTGGAAQGVAALGFQSLQIGGSGQFIAGIELDFTQSAGQTDVLGQQPPQIHALEQGVFVFIILIVGLFPPSLVVADDFFDLIYQFLQISQGVGMGLFAAVFLHHFHGDGV